MKTVCLITSGHISTDPRLIKEAGSLSEIGIHVHIIFSQYVLTEIPKDKKILNDNPEWSYDCLNWSGNNFLSKLRRFTCGFLQKSAFYIWTKTNVLLFVPLALNRNYLWQLRKAKKLRAILYIGHNLGTLPVVVAVSQFHRVKCGFDAEDFHRYESSDNHNDLNVILKKQAENKYLRHLNYMSAASPLIAEQYAHLFNLNVIPILNVFQKTIRHKFVNSGGVLKLFWFSQTVGPNRGLETIFEAIKISEIPLELHLLGEIGKDYKKQLLNLKSNNLHLTFHASVHQEDLFNLAAEFDIGLATEPIFPFNRNICLTNKLFAYIQNGLAVVASNTHAQRVFFQLQPKIGSIYKNINELVEIFHSYNSDRALLLRIKKNCFELGQKDINWESEKVKFLNIIKELIYV
jgi:glycosyltransferase involved in cell wall biosynthesis